MKITPLTFKYSYMYPSCNAT